MPAFVRATDAELRELLRACAERGCSLGVSRATQVLLEVIAWRAWCRRVGMMGPDLPWNRL